MWYDIVRPGLLLYGIVPPPLASTIPLKPVMSLTSRVVAREGTAAGRSRRLRLPLQQPTRRRRLPSCPPGYADGLDLRLERRGQVLIRGRRVPIVGAVSMDMMTVDVTGLDEVSRETKS